MKSKLVGGFNPFEKYVRQIGSFPHVVPVTIKNYLKPPARNLKYILKQTVSGGSWVTEGQVPQTGTNCKYLEEKHSCLLIL